jgi:hypothetical protein
MDTSALESEVENQTEASLLAEHGMVFVTVVCPEMVPNEIGHEFTCLLTTPSLPGDRLTVEATIQNEDGEALWRVTDS